MKKWSKILALGLCVSLIGTAALAEDTAAATGSDTDQAQQMQPPAMPDGQQPANGQQPPAMPDGQQPAQPANGQQPAGPMAQARTFIQKFIDLLGIKVDQTALDEFFNSFGAPQPGTQQNTDTLGQA